MDAPLALIGFGEAGSAFASAGGWGEGAVAWDTLALRREAAVAAGLRPAISAGEALAGARLVLSLVTADQAVAAARAYAPLLLPGAIWCDMNSVSPETKRAAAEAVEAGGGHYLDVAVLAPVNPAQLAVPLLLAGPEARMGEELLRAAGFGNVRVVGPDVGRASAIKMIRSVMVKGMEALTAEMMLAAEAAGVVDEVLTSLDASERTMPWGQRAAYNCERMASHGLRRAAEMEEAAATLEALRIAPLMTRMTAMRQRAAAAQQKDSGQ